MSRYTGTHRRPVIDRTCDRFQEVFLRQLEDVLGMPAIAAIIILLIIVTGH